MAVSFGHAGITRVQREFERFGTHTIRTDRVPKIAQEVAEQVVVQWILRGVGVRDTRDSTD